MPPSLILASTSRYRADLLHQMGLQFQQVNPDLEEVTQAGEAPAQQAARLAREKAHGAALKMSYHNPAIFIGSDQVAHCGSTIFTKPGNYPAAFQQLKESVGQWVSFSTGICLCDENGQVLASEVDSFEIKYRSLDDEAIQQYLTIEKPYDCAGSIKAEARGIALIAETRGNDINTLYGLPLILLTELLSKVGYDVIGNLS